MWTFILLAGLALANAQSEGSGGGYSQYGGSEAVYPSPATKGLGGWEDALAKAKTFVADLTVAEKAYLATGVNGPCTGNIMPIPRKNFSGLCLQDGPTAIRQADFASVFPAGLTTAASWNKGLMYTRGKYMGEEFRGKGSHIALGPVAGPLGRVALGGRNWEGFSPDPYLTATAFERTISGMQRAGVQACGKHFIGNEQETQRNPSQLNGASLPSTNFPGLLVDAVSSNIDDRTMHELYLWPFAEGVRAGMSSIMCSYNRVNGSYACQNSKILNGLLKEELGFQGYVMSDWEGTHSGVASVEAGLDMNMPGPFSFFSVDPTSFFGGNLTAASTNGSVSMDRLDDMCTRILTPYFKLEQDNYPLVDPSSADLNLLSPPFLYNSSEWTFGNRSVDVRGRHADLIRDLGAEGIVLLKNEENVLPLKAPKVLGIFGNDAADLTDGLFSQALNVAQGLPAGSYEIGCQFVGGGSGTGRLSSVVSPLEAIKARARKDGTLVQYITNNKLVSFGFGSSVYPLPDICLVFLKTFATEGADRTSYEADWDSTTLVNTVAAACANTIVITHSGGINTYPWASHPNVKGILAAHYGGQEAGAAIAAVLYGDVNPSGHLPYTIANASSDYNTAIANFTGAQDTNAWQSDFSEGLLIDYRHFDHANIAPLFPFGFGLSYTTFALSTLRLTTILAHPTALPPPFSATAIPPGGNPTLYDIVLHVSATVSNTGLSGGATVPQLYLALPLSSAPPDTPVRVLRGFEKLSLQPGESAEVGFDLRRKDVSFWNVERQDWEIAAGEMTVSVGFSSRDLWLNGTVTLV